MVTPDTFVTPDFESRYAVTLNRFAAWGRRPLAACQSKKKRRGATSRSIIVKFAFWDTTLLMPSLPPETGAL